MSRIGKKPITVPSGVKVTLDPKARTINVEGPKGKLSFNYRPEVAVAWDEGEHRNLGPFVPESLRPLHYHVPAGSHRRYAHPDPECRA